jgi:hypothetical protein
MANFTRQFATTPENTRNSRASKCDILSMAQVHYDPVQVSKMNNAELARAADAEACQMACSFIIWHSFMDFFSKHDVGRYTDPTQRLGQYLDKVYRIAANEQQP